MCLGLYLVLINSWFIFAPCALLFFLHIVLCWLGKVLFSDTMPDAWVDFRKTFRAWMHQICTLCLGYEGCGTAATIRDSSTLHAFVKKNLEQAWSKSAGPSKASLSTLCCEVLAEGMDVGSSIGTLHSLPRDTSDRECLEHVPRRFTYMIMPFLLIRSLYCLLADQSKGNGPNLLAHASPLVLDDLLRHSAYCEVGLLTRGQAADRPGIVLRANVDGACARSIQEL